MAEPLVFVCPLPENRANSRGHWASKFRTQKAYLKTLDARVLLGKLPRPPRTPFRGARLHITLRVWKKAMDPDNAWARVKWPVDWLVSRKYVADDRKSLLDFEAVVVEVVQHRTATGCVMVLTPPEGIPADSRAG